MDIRALAGAGEAGDRGEAVVGAGPVRADGFRVPRDDLHAAAYWKAGTDATAVDSDTLTRYQRAAATGADVTDPDTADLIAFGD